MSVHIYVYELPSIPLTNKTKKFDIINSAGAHSDEIKYDKTGNYHFAGPYRSLKNCTSSTTCICRWSRLTPSLQNNTYHNPQLVLQ